MKADCPPGKVCYYDENGKLESVEDDKEPVVIETKVKGNTEVETVLLTGRRSGFRNQFQRAFHNLGSWLRHWFGPKTPPKPPAPPAPASQPNQVYGPPSPPVQSGPSTILQFGQQQIQKKFKHARDFGVQGSYNANNAQQFQQAVQNHTTSAGTQVINGTYRGQPVTHHFNPQTQLNVITDRAGNFISGWKLNPAQAQNVVTRGSL